MKKNISGLFFFLIFITSGFSVDAAVISGINLMEEGKKIGITLDEYSDFRVYQSDKYEFIIIFKGTEIDENIVTGGSGGTSISKILYEHFPDDISILTIKTAREIQSVGKVWNEATGRLEVSLKFGGGLIAGKKYKSKNKRPKYGRKHGIDSSPMASSPGSSSKSSSSIDEMDTEDFRALIKGKKKSKKETPKKGFKLEEIDLSTPSLAKKNYEKGGVDTITKYLRGDDCSKSLAFKVALRLADEENFVDALASVENQIDQSEDMSCIDKLEFFRAYLEFKALEKEGPASKIVFKKDVEALVNKYPMSPMIPYGYALAGLLNDHLGNPPFAMGYFELIEKNHAKYPGMAEVLYEFGHIYYDKGDLISAENYLKQLRNDYPKTKFAQEASFLEGQILYSKKRYFDTIRTLSPLIEDNQKVLYENPKLLNFVANSYFQTGKNDEARGLFSRIFNIFPGVEEKDMILTRIGETFEEQGQKEKALKIYRLVTERYPGTNGYVKSSLKLADNMDDEENREIIYTMIVNEFPETTEARIALMRLANIYLKQKKYIESIDAVKIVLKENARALKKDALYVMSQSLHGELEKLTKEDKFPIALRMVERERFYIEEMKTWPIHLKSGEIYYKAHLYKDAEERLKMGLKLLGKKKPPVEIYRYVAISKKELGKSDEALTYLKKIIEDYKDEEEKALAYETKGDIELERKKTGEAEKFYNEAVKRYSSLTSRGSTSVKLGEMFEKENNLEKAKKYFYDAVSIYLSVNKEDVSEDIAYTSRKLGEFNIKLNDYKEAVNSFKKVIEAGGGKENISEVRFLLGEAYKGLDEIESALEEYNKVLAIETDDEFWKKVAVQRIKEIELNKEVNDS